MSAAPSDKSDETTAPAPAATPQAVPTAPRPSGLPTSPAARVLLAVSAVLFFGWLAWLSYTALTKSRDPIVSRVQVAVAPVPVVANVEADDKGAPKVTVTVEESLLPNGPPKGTVLTVVNLPGARGFTEKGKYLL